MFRLGSLTGVLGSGRRVLEGALAPFPGLPADDEDLAEDAAWPEGGVLPGAGATVLRLPLRPSPEPGRGRPIEPGASLGWVAGALPAPFRDDRYIVEFVGRGEVRVLAYLDRFGRAFSADEPSEVPPARTPDLSLVRDDAVRGDADEGGWVVVGNPGGEERRVAAYRMTAGRYEVVSSWYDFGSAGRGLSYPDFMARAYVACVYRPALTGIPVPSCGLGCVFELLEVPNAVRGLRAVRLLVERARRDPALRPPALASLLVDWLEEAGFTDRASRAWLYAAGADDEAGPLRLIRTRRYADTFYLAAAGDEPLVPERVIWAVESALNRFLLLCDTMGDRAALASEAECAHWDDDLRRRVAAQVSGASHPADEGADRPAGEWATRVAMAESLESLRLPYRLEAAFDVDVAQPGVAAWAVTAPDASLMPPRRYDEAADAWVDCSPAERAAEALSYAAHLGIALAAASFSATAAIDEVMVTARALADDEAADGGQAEGPLLCQVTFDRARFTEKRAYRAAALGDPLPFIASFGALLGDGLVAAGPLAEPELAARDPFALLEGRAACAVRRDAPECADAPLDAAQQAALGARSARDLRVTFDGELLSVVERLAGAVAEAPSVQEAIRLVRAEQDATGDPLVYQGCTRLMTALTQGDVALHDREAVRGCLVGDDALAQAAARARALVRQDAQQAADVLAEAIAAAEASGRFTDTTEAVHRFFDGYASRLAYNRREPDGARQVEVVPASLLLCYLDAINLLDESFSQSEAAVAYGRRCIELAPTFALAYRRCARAYMLVGDLESAADLLVRCLSFTLSPDEAAMAYYQLAYVEWKAGRPREGLACYCKSLLSSPVYAPQVSVELHELMREEGVALPARDQVDDVLDAAGIPVAPVGDRLVELDEAMRAAVDANLFSVGRTLLGTYLRHRPDDALAGVLRSLDVGR
ncbi:MAG: hypothetical protein HFJ75_09955 [Eggerthellaceae bacterium]|nr:hypothetical protein [Eggerthellaceae bacterium]